MFRRKISEGPSFLRRVKSFPLQAACEHTERARPGGVRSIRGRVCRLEPPPRPQVCGSPSVGLGEGRVEREQSLPGHGLPLTCTLASSLPCQVQEEGPGS